MVGLIQIRGLALSLIVGVHPHERTQPQPILMDLDLRANLGLAGQSDELGQTLDYDAVVREVKKISEQSSFFLIEKLAVFVMDHLLDAFPRIDAIILTVHKPKALKDCSISIQVHKNRA